MQQRHLTDSMDEVTMIQVFEPILVGIVCVGTTIETVSRRIFHPILVMSILVSGPLHPNAPSVLFCAFPRPASPTSSTYPIGCPSPT